MAYFDNCKRLAKTWIGAVMLFSGVVVLSVFAGSAQAENQHIAQQFDFKNATIGQQLGCLAMNIYHEGRGESPQGRAAIASVTMNRVRSKHYPNSICEVVWQPRQFSWTNVAPKHHVVKDSRAWQQALAAARLFIAGEGQSEVGDATHYHAVTVQPNWSDESKLVAMLGGHLFYTL